MSGYKDCQKEQRLLIHIYSITGYGAIHKAGQPNRKKVIENSMKTLNNKCYYPVRAEPFV